MHDGSTIIRQRQLDVRSEIEARGFHLKVVASKSGIPYPTLLTYFPADMRATPVQIPGGAIYALIESRALPSDILSMLTPAGWALIEIPEEYDHDEIEDACRDVLEAKGAAHHKDSPGGREITDCEREVIDLKVIQLRGKVRA